MMHTGVTKEADEVVHAYLVNMFSKFGALHKFFQIMVLNLRITCLCKFLPLWE